MPSPRPLEMLPWCAECLAREGCRGRYHSKSSPGSSPKSIAISAYHELELHKREASCQTVHFTDRHAEPPWYPRAGGSPRATKCPSSPGSNMSGAPPSMRTYKVVGRLNEGSPAWATNRVGLLRVGAGRLFLVRLFTLRKDEEGRGRVPALLGYFWFRGGVPPAPALRL